MSDETTSSRGELDADGWRRVEEIFHRLRAEAPTRWRALADEACGDDPRIRQEVLALLGAEGDGQALEGAIRGAVDGWLGGDLLGGDLQGGDLLGGDPSPLTDPEEIGPFRILERIGEGGLAVVYLAERDQPFHQKVAIKLLKRGLETEEILRRLKLEGQILAQLEHPNVARLLDGGWTDDGRPYFVLEHVQGEPIDRYCDSRRLDIFARLRLFHTSCLAVQQAHNRLVVHRDLKPSNLLVTTQGEPKLLDFGIAKLLDTSHLPHAGAAAAVTRPGASWMTPDYAAPEQIAGGELTTAVDVYGLGVLLYQLLCGRLPRQPVGKTALEAERLLDHTPPPPSEQLEPTAAAARGGTVDSVSRVVRGDLDNLVAKALEADPARRYASAQQLAEDVQRFLRSEPLVARPDTWIYRADKFVRRHRTAVGASVLVVLSLVVGVVAAMLGLRQARHQHNLAQQRLAEMEAVVDFTAGMFEISDPGEARGSRVTAREILDRGAERISGPRADSMDGQPAVKARLMDTMGRVYRNLGLYGSAHDLLSRASRQWLKAGKDYRLDALAGRRRLVAVLLDQGDLDGADAALKEIRAEEARLGPELAAHKAGLAETLHLSGLLARAVDDPRAASLLRQALQLRVKSLGADHLAVAESRNDLGEILDQPEAAREQLGLALSIRRKHLGPDHPLVAETLHNLATLHQETGELDAAEQSFRTVLAIRRKVLGDVHRDVAVTLNNLGEVLHRQERHSEALESYREAVRIARQTIPMHPTTAGLLSNLALELRDCERLDEAIEVMAEAVDLRFRLFGRTTEQAQLDFNYAVLLSSAGRRREAVAELEEILSDMQELGLTGFPLSYPLTLLADLLADEGDCGRSGALASQALELRSELADDHPLRVRAREVAARCPGVAG